MKSLNLSQGALSICLAATLFAGCGGSQSPLGAAGHNTLVPGTARTQPTNGGAFSAVYSGTYHFSKQPCDINEPKGNFRFHGAGSASFLDQSSEAGRLKISGAIGFCYTNGAVTLASAKYPTDTITARVGLGHNELPCKTLLSYKIKRGTGKFVNAHGSGTINLRCHGRRMYSDEWSGTLYY